MAQHVGQRGAATWLRRLPVYQYLSDLVTGQRVLEVGCGTGEGAAFLASSRAVRVVGIDESASAIETAARRHRLSNLQLRCEDPAVLQLEDDSFDLILVPEATRLVRRRAVLRELRRVLAPGGLLVASAPSADRPAARGGLSYYELVDRLEPDFGPVRMIAQAPMVSLSLVEYADDAGEPHIELDTTLFELERDEVDVTDYVALCGGEPDVARGFSIVQVPSHGGLAAVSASLGLAHAGHPELEAPPRPAADEPAEDAATLAARLTALEEQLDGARAELAEVRIELGEALDELDQTRDDLGEAQGELDRLERIEGELSETRAALEAERASPRLGSELEAARAEAADARTRLLAVEDELARTRAAKAIDLDQSLAMHAHVERDLRQRLEDARGYERELRDEIETLRDDARRAEDARARSEATISTLWAELARWRDRAAQAEGQVLALQRSPSPEQQQRLTELEAELHDTRAKLERTTQNWKDAESRSDEIWRRVGEVQSELERHREQAVLRSAEQRRSAQMAMTKALEDSSAKIVSLKNQLLKIERERDEAESALLDARTALSDAEARRGELETHIDEIEAERARLEARVAEVEQAGERSGADGPAAAGPPADAGDAAWASHAAHHAGNGEPAQARRESAPHEPILRERMREIERKLDAERELLSRLERGIAELRAVSVEDFADGSLEARVADLAMTLGVKDAEMTLLDVGNQSLQQRLADIVAQVVQTRDDMSGKDAAAMQSMMSELASLLTEK